MDITPETREEAQRRVNCFVLITVIIVIALVIVFVGAEIMEVLK